MMSHETADKVRKRMQVRPSPYDFFWTSDMVDFLTISVFIYIYIYIGYPCLQTHTHTHIDISIYIYMYVYIYIYIVGLVICLGRAAVASLLSPSAAAPSHCPPQPHPPTNHCTVPMKTNVRRSRLLQGRSALCNWCTGDAAP